MLKPKLQYFGLLIIRANSMENTLMLGKIESKKRRKCQSMKQLDGITDSMDMSLSTLRETMEEGLACCSPWGHMELDLT